MSGYYSLSSTLNTETHHLRVTVSTGKSQYSVSVQREGNRPATYVTKSPVPGTSGEAKIIWSWV